LPLRFTIRVPAASGTASPEDVGAVRTQDVLAPLKEDGLVFGRSPDASIPVPLAKVSARHARLWRTATGFCIEDLASANGTRLAGRKLASHVPCPIAAGEVITLGGVEVRFEGESPDAAPVAAALGTQTLARRLVHDLFAGGAVAERAHLVVLSGPEQGREVGLSASGRDFTIGRGEGCDLILADEEVSREHAVVARGPGGFVVRDLQSKNGVEVAGAYIGGERPLRDGEIVRVGETRWRFFDPEDRYLRQLAAADAEGQGEAPTVGAAPLPTAASARSKLPVIAAVVAVAVLLGAGGVLLALAFVGHL
jgi:pSer/pThr/pTyr-binding forkhead associated (FHA) protein